MKATWQWIKGRLGYIYLILILLVVVPAVLIAVTSAIQDTDIGKPTLEFLLGTWPAQEYSDNIIDSFKVGVWLYVGIALRYWAVFLVPVILAMVIAWLVRRIKGLETMLLRDYLGYRDTFIRTEVYAAFVDVVNKTGMTDSDFKSALEEAYRRADEEWHGTASETYKKRISEITL